MEVQLEYFFLCQFFLRLFSLTIKKFDLIETFQEIFDSLALLLTQKLPKIDSAGNYAFNVCLVEINQAECLHLLEYRDPTMAECCQTL